MADSAKLLAHLQSEEFEHGVRQRFWALQEVCGSTVYVWLFAPDDRSYLIELDCFGYGDAPIRGRFVDSATRQCVSSAWPQGNATFEQWIKFSRDFFICWDQDQAGIEHHSDWKARKAWEKPNQLVSYLDFLRQLLHVEARGYLRKNPKDA
jgi:hypothetical protein